MNKQNQFSHKMHLILISWCFFFCFSHSLDNSSASFSPKRCLPDQVSALLQLKQEFAFQKFYFSLTYFDPEEYPHTYPKMKFWKAEKDCCSWGGVTCSAITGHVESLDLSCSWLHGPLHSNSSLFNLHHLRRLNLAFNNFTLSSIPSEIGQLSRLTHLNLSSAFLSGNIPPEISWLTKLVSLDLSANIIGEIITTLNLQNRDLITRIVKNVTNLKELRLDKVELFQPLPESLANLSSSETLSLSSCNLSGVFPTNIFQLPNLQYLDVGSNDNLIGFLPEFRYGSNLTWLSLSSTAFSGALPQSIGNLKSLNVLDLGDCSFSGSLPSILWNLSELTVLDLSANNFNGNHQLLSKIGNLTKLTRLAVDSAQFTCEVPFSIGNLMQLKYLSLSKSDFSGPIPYSLGNLTQLEHLDLSENNFSGPIPYSLGNLTQLELLDLSENNFCGPIPFSLGNLTQLEDLFLWGNNFSGPIPYSLGNLTQLKHLFLLQHNFNGPIPNSLGNLTKLEILDLSGNNFSGPIQYSLGNLTKLEILDLSGNNFSGPIPYSLGNLTKLEILDLSEHNFSGPIPYSLGNLKKLQALNLSNNSFSGQIPDSLGNLSQLESLDLTINQLNGVIPWSLFTIPSLVLLELDHNQLRGPLNIPCLSSSKLRTLSITGNKFHGQIPKSISSLTNLEEINLDSNFFSGIVEWGIFSEMKRLDSLDLSYNYKISKFTNAHRMTSFPPKLGTFRLASCNISEFPEFLKSQHELHELDLSNNRIEGPIPSWFLDVATESLLTLDLSYNYISSWEQAPLILPWKKLEYIDLHSNKLHGSLVVPSLSTAYYIISENNLSGSILPLFCNLSYLQVLDVSNNNLTGIIPTCLGKRGTSLRELRTLDLSNNQIQGKVPRSLISCTMLEILNLGHNQISDTFPFWLSKLPELQVLVLRSNQFYGHVWRSSTEPLDFKKLRIIDLSFNKLSGNLPSEYFASWSAMIEASSQDNSGQLRYMGNDYYHYKDSVTVMNKGQEVKLVRIITIFTSIDLSNNRFDGEIPRSMDNLLSLIVLNLSSNSFRGPIPSAFGNLKELESLDLSKNNLTGLIPLDFVKLTFLSYLNLSQNHLTGHIPEGGQMGTFPSSAFEGNSGLCGSPLARLCDDEHAEPPASPNNNQEADEFDFGWKVVVMGYGCGLVVGLVAGHVIISKWPIWFSKTFRVNLLQRRRR